MEDNSTYLFLLSGGCGAVAVLIGRNAPLVVDRCLMSIYSADTSEFRRPVQNYPFPVFDGPETNRVFYSALDEAYLRLCEKADKLNNVEWSGRSTKWCTLAVPLIMSISLSGQA